MVSLVVIYVFRVLTATFYLRMENSLVGWFFCIEENGIDFIINIHSVRNGLFIKSSSRDNVFIVNGLSSIRVIMS